MPAGVSASRVRRRGSKRQSLLTHHARTHAPPNQTISLWFHRYEPRTQLIERVLPPELIRTVLLQQAANQVSYKMSRGCLSRTQSATYGNAPFSFVSPGDTHSKHSHTHNAKHRLQARCSTVLILRFVGHVSKASHTQLKANAGSSPLVIPHEAARAEGALNTHHQTLRKQKQVRHQHCSSVLQRVSGAHSRMH